MLAGGIDVVVHFAAEKPRPTASIMGCQEFIRTNVAGTQVLLDAARAHKVGLLPFKYRPMRSTARWGRPDSSPSRLPLHPNSPYSASKAAADLLVFSYHHTYGMPVVITPVLEQLWAVPIPGEADSAVHHEPHGRQEGASLRRRHERAGLDPRVRPLQGDPAGD